MWRISRNRTARSALSTSLPVHSQHRWKHSGDTGPRESNRSRLSTSMCIPVVRRWSGMWRRRGEGAEQNQRINPMQSKLPMHRSARCGARTRSGSLCRSPAVPNGRCRMHGGISPGAPKGNKNAFKHGNYSAKGIAEWRSLTALIRSLRALAKSVE